MFFVKAKGGIRVVESSGGLGDWYKGQEIAFPSGLRRKHLDPKMNREPPGVLCIFGSQCIGGNFCISSLTYNPKRAWNLVCPGGGGTSICGVYGDVPPNRVYFQVTNSETG